MAIRRQAFASPREASVLANAKFRRARRHLSFTDNYGAPARLDAVASKRGASSVQPEWRMAASIWDCGRQKHSIQADTAGNYMGSLRRQFAFQCTRRSGRRWVGKLTSHESGETGVQISNFETCHIACQSPLVPRKISARHRSVAPGKGSIVILRMRPSELPAQAHAGPFRFAKRTSNRSVTGGRIAQEQRGAVENVGEKMP